MNEPATILVVDDMPANRKLLADLLVLKGYQVVTAASGEEALAKVDAVKPDLVLLDIVMPGLNGYEVCRRLKENPATQPIPVIVVTAVLDEPVSRRAYEAGAVACILKPIRWEALLAMIQAGIAGAERRAKAKAKREAKSA